jgi:hypothetical protein
MFRHNLVPKKYIAKKEQNNEKSEEKNNIKIKLLKQI